MPGKSGSPEPSLRIRLRRSSAFTEATPYSERRRSPTVCGRVAISVSLHPLARSTGLPNRSGGHHAPGAAEPAGLAHAPDQPVGDARVLAEVEVQEGGHQVALHPSLAAQRLA